MTRRTSFFRIDENVFFTMSGAILLFLVILGFRVATRTECKPIKITVGDGLHYTGELVPLRAETSNAKSYEWDFGDGTPMEKRGPSIMHKYDSSGKYTVSVLINGSCYESIDVYIIEKPPPPPPASSTNFLLSPQTENDVYMTGQEITFNDPDTTHTSWTWFAEEGGSPIGTLRSQKHKYDTEGFKKVSVRINNNQILHKWIQIVLDPVEKEKRDRAALRRQEGGDTKIDLNINNNPTEQPLQPPVDNQVTPVQEKTKYPEISDPQMGTMIQNYHDDKVAAADFTKYFCDGAGPTVIFEKKSMSWAEFLGEVKGVKKIKRVTAILTKEESNCISKINAKIERKKTLGIF
jgi:hypothetical protein